ncbi:MAG: hypothetical protein AABW64_02725, partial [Nanoarchaeota archaeon]
FRKRLSFSSGVRFSLTARDYDADDSFFVGNSDSAKKWGKSLLMNLIFLAGCLLGSEQPIILDV